MVYGGVTHGTKGGGFNSGAAEFYPFSAVQFKPETLYNYEAGVKAITPDRLFSIDASIFYYDYKNYQSYTLPNRNWTVAAFANNFTDETIVSTRVDFTTVTANSVDSIDRPRWIGNLPLLNPWASSLDSPAS